MVVNMNQKTSENSSIKTFENQKVEKKECNKDFWCKFVVGTKIAVIAGLITFLAIKIYQDKCQDCKKVNIEKIR